jgi:hypothetical protein
VQLDIAFEGDAVNNGQMNVRDLAPSMLAIGTLFESANKVLNGERADIGVNVKATTAGSFHILYEVIQSPGANQILQEMLSTAVDMKELIFGGSIALFTIVKLLKGKNPKVEKINNNLFKLTIDKETYEVPLEFIKLYQDISTRKAISEIVRPVRANGINKLVVRDKKRLLQTVNKSEIDYFNVPEVKDPILDQISQKAFSLVSLAFKDDYKWRLTDGQVVYSVSIKDDAFLKRVDNNELSFAKGDVLLCNLRTIQWQVEDGVKTEYEILKVIDHKTARQLPLIDWMNPDTKNT